METMARLQAQWQEENYLAAERENREREIAEQGIRAAIMYERSLEKRHDIRSNIITVMLGLVYIAIIACMFLDAFFI